MDNKVNIKELKKARKANDMFCRECGDTDPKSGWYPGNSGSSEDVSSLLCNDCDRVLREGKPIEKIKNPDNTTHDQIIHFIGGYKRTIYNVEYVWENEMTHIITADGIEWIINKDNVLCVERIRRDLKRPYDLQDK